ncbi:MAG TPA: amino acid ABC transporter permease [Stellaceae bacterium]|nr:amino acid ABC transporter permease [Stellaceae bacterium]
MSVLLENIGPLALTFLRYNIAMTVSAIAIALPVACLFAVGRLSRFPLVHLPVTAYVNLLRSSPLLMIMFWAYYTGPMLTGHPNSAYLSALLALAAFEVAYFTEIIRTGLQSIAIDQRSAGLATGLTSPQVTRLVVLPQALMRMLPSLVTQSIIAFQDSTIASVIGVSDVLQSVTIINARDQRPIELYTALALGYFLVCYLSSRWVRRLEVVILHRLSGARE